MHAGNNPAYQLPDPEVFNVEIGCSESDQCKLMDIGCTNDVGKCFTNQGKPQCNCHSGMIMLLCNTLYLTFNLLCYWFSGYYILNY